MTGRVTGNATDARKCTGPEMEVATPGGGHCLVLATGAGSGGENLPADVAEGRASQTARSKRTLSGPSAETATFHSSSTLPAPRVTPVARPASPAIFHM